MFSTLRWLQEVEDRAVGAALQGCLLLILHELFHHVLPLPSMTPLLVTVRCPTSLNLIQRGRFCLLLADLFRSHQCAVELERDRRLARAR